MHPAYTSLHIEDFVLRLASRTAFTTSSAISMSGFNSTAIRWAWGTSSDSVCWLELSRSLFPEASIWMGSGHSEGHPNPAATGSAPDYRQCGSLE